MRLKKIVHWFINQIVLDIVVKHGTWFFFKFFCKGEVRNIQILRDLADKPFMIALNHTSHLDWFMLYPLFNLVLNREVSFLAKKELFQSPGWKPFMDYAQSISLDREKVSPQILREMIRAVRANKIIGIFPEGTRSQDGEMLKGKEGMVRIASALNVPIVPIGLSGFNRVLPKGKKIPKPYKCVIIIGEPVNLSAESVKNSAGECTELVMKKIAHLSSQDYSFSHSDSV